MVNYVLNKKTLKNENIIEFVSKYPAEINLFEISSEMRKKILLNNPNALKYIAKSQQSIEECYIAVNKDSSVFPYVSKKLLNEELCLLALKSNGLLLEYVPEKLRSESLDNIAVAQNGSALKFVNNPTYDMCKLALKTSSEALQYIPSILIDNDLIELSISYHAESIKYVRVDLLTQNIVNVTLKKDIRAIVYVPSNYICKADYVKYLKYLIDNNERGFKLAEKLPNVDNSIKKDPEIINLYNKLQIYRYINKYYDEDKKVFCVTKHKFWYPFYEKFSFDSYEDYYTFLNGDISDVNWNGYNYSNVEKNLCNFHLLRNSNGVYIENPNDDCFFENCEDELSYNKVDDYICDLNVNHENDLIVNSISNRKIFYISDLHLNHKIKHHFNGIVDEVQIKLYINSIVEKMFDSLDVCLYDYLLIAGDISFRIDLADIFFNCVAKHFNTRNIIVVLGNHELWEDDNIDLTIDKYRKMLTKYGITLLHNELLVIDSKRFNTSVLNFKFEKVVFSYSQLASMSDDALKRLLSYNQFCVLGGVGFSGFCNEHNAETGLYRGSVKTIDDDIKQTNYFLKIYNKLKDFSDYCNLIVLTHMPRENWSKDEYVSNWIYVNGHTHMNKFCIQNNKKVFSDNQIGYNNPIFLKHFYISTDYDVFCDYEDGEYEITRVEYMDFNRGKGIVCNFNSFDGKIHMLKNAGLYCFLYENRDGNLFLLNGGTKNKLDIQDVNYYYNNMVVYSNIIKEQFSLYNQSLQRLSKDIKSIGGRGSIHGCIVDIDYYNHIYLNIFDGTITPYNATNIRDKHTYKSIKALLLRERKDLYEQYKSLPKDKLFILGKKEKVLCNSDGDNVDYLDTDIYKPSRKMRQIQYLIDCNIIRVWNDEILLGEKLLDN